MPAIVARKTNDAYRCSLPDCGSLLFKGELIVGFIEIKCKCGAMNTITATSNQDNQENRSTIERVVIRQPEQKTKRKNGQAVANVSSRG